MVSHWHIDDLLTLIRARYPHWDGFAHPLFVADEIAYKQSAVAKGQAWLSAGEWQRLLNGQAYEELVQRLEKLGKDNNLLWRSVPAKGDLGILYAPNLNKAEFCLAMRDLLHGADDTPERLQRFVQYTQRYNLPCTWPFATYFLFLMYPTQEMFVRPGIVRWFLQFMGVGSAYQSQPNAQTYATLLQQSHLLQHALASYGPQDMVDLQSFIWVCARESQTRTGRLDLRSQVELDVPATLYTIPQPAGISLREHEDDQIEDNAAIMNPPYSIEECAQETGFAEKDLGEWARAIERKKQAIFYGPPGTGKTYLAQKLARHLVGGSDGLVELVQFHPAYAYEDFIQGIRPHITVSGGISYEWTDGVFLRFCRQAQQRQGRCVLIIDEINRANLARVLGELLYLLEYRERSITLAGGQPFTIPANVRLLGTMNTADRSIALVDHALRRRFAFIALQPEYELLRRYHAQTGFDSRNLIVVLQRLNSQINDPHFAVGPAFFLHPDLPNQIEAIWRMEIEPYLEEYFFNQLERVDAFRWEKIEAQLL